MPVVAKKKMAVKKKEVSFDMRRADCIIKIARWFRKHCEEHEKTDGWNEWCFRSIAARAGVCASTVSRLYNAEVKHPWTDKFMSILSDGCMMTVTLTIKPRESRGVLRLMS